MIHTDFCSGRLNALGLPDLLFSHSETRAMIIRTLRKLWSFRNLFFSFGHCGIWSFRKYERWKYNTGSKKTWTWTEPFLEGEPFLVFGVVHRFGSNLQTSWTSSNLFEPVWIFLNLYYNMKKIFLAKHAPLSPMTAPLQPTSNYHTLPHYFYERLMLAAWCFMLHVSCLMLDAWCTLYGSWLMAHGWGGGGNGGAQNLMVSRAQTDARKNRALKTRNTKKSQTSSVLNFGWRHEPPTCHQEHTKHQASSITQQASSMKHKAWSMKHQASKT